MPSYADDRLKTAKTLDSIAAAPDRDRVGGVIVWASVSIRYSVLLVQDKASALDVNVLHLVGLFL